MENNFGHILIATGSYSDYQNTLFRVLKPFNMQEILDEFKSTDEFKNIEYLFLQPECFKTYLQSQGYIENVSVECQEIHIDNDYCSEDEGIVLSDNANQTFNPR